MKKAFLGAMCVFSFSLGSAFATSGGIAALYENSFMVGTIVNNKALMDPPDPASSLSCREFNVYTAENAMKWENIHPSPDVFTFALADQLIKTAEQCDANVIGHTLVWHQQTPEWVFKDVDGNALSRDQLLMRLREHIHTVVGRYKGKIYGWDVVNEALNEDGSLRDSRWRQIIGDDYILQAFRFAREADPSAQLYYNDFNLYKTKKVGGAINLVKQLAEDGVNVDAIGMQGHYSLFYPSIKAVQQSMQAIVDAGISIAITELDVSVLPLPEGFDGAEITQNFATHPVYDPYVKGLPDTQQNALADTYQELFSLFLRFADKVDRVSFWGTHDGESWRNNWPIKGRTDYPLLFDRNGQPKRVYQRITQHIP